MKSIVIDLNYSAEFQEFLYPAGETQIRLTTGGIRAVSHANCVNVVARIRGAGDIMRLALLRSAIKSSVDSCAEVVLVLPYLPYSRADRRFVDGDCHGLSAFAS